MTVASFASRTDVGRKRTHNEDAVIAADPLFGVADGVGGAVSGERASQLALEVLAQWSQRVAEAVDEAGAEAAMAEAIAHSNTAVVNAQRDDARLSGMATTVTAAVVRTGGVVVIGHVGDSRAYRIGAGRVQQVTDDHSIVGELVRSGELTLREAATHPKRNVITRALGSEQHVAVDTLVLRAQPGEWFLLCSDGLTGYVNDDEFVQALGSDTAEEVVHELVAWANERGGGDNVSVVVFQPLAAPDAQHETAVAMLATAMPTGQSSTEISAELAVVSINQAAEAAHAPRRARGQHPPSRGRVVRNVALAALVVLIAFLVSAFAWNESYFVVERANGTIGIDHGFPVNGLHEPDTRSDSLASNLPARDRARLRRRSLRSRTDAQKLFDDLVAQSTACREAVATARDVGKDGPAFAPIDPACE